MTLAIKSFDRCTPNVNYEDQNAVPSPGLGTLSGVLCGEELGQLHTRCFIPSSRQTCEAVSILFSL